MGNIAGGIAQRDIGGKYCPGGIVQGNPVQGILSCPCPIPCPHVHMVSYWQDLPWADDPGTSLCVRDDRGGRGASLCQVHNSLSIHHQHL